MAYEQFDPAARNIIALNQSISGLVGAFRQIKSDQREQTKFDDAQAAMTLYGNHLRGIETKPGEDGKLPEGVSPKQYAMYRELLLEGDEKRLSNEGMAQKNERERVELFMQKGKQREEEVKRLGQGWNAAVQTNQEELADQMKRDMYSRFWPDGVQATESRLTNGKREWYFMDKEGKTWWAEAPTDAEVQRQLDLVGDPKKGITEYHFGRQLMAEDAHNRTQMADPEVLVFKDGRRVHKYDFIREGIPSTEYIDVVTHERISAEDIQAGGEFENRGKVSKQPEYAKKVAETKKTVQEAETEEAKADYWRRGGKSAGTITQGQLMAAHQKALKYSDEKLESLKDVNGKFWNVALQREYTPQELQIKRKSFYNEAMNFHSGTTPGGVIPEGETMRSGLDQIKQELGDEMNPHGETETSQAKPTKAPKITGEEANQDTGETTITTDQDVKPPTAAEKARADREARKQEKIKNYRERHKYWMKSGSEETKAKKEPALGAELPEGETYSEEGIGKVKSGLMNESKKKSALPDLIMKNEGKNVKGGKHVPFTDPVNKKVSLIGYGHKIETAAEAEKYKDGITESEAKALLQEDIKRAEDAVKGLPETVLNNLSQAQYEVLVEMAFQMGGKGLKGFEDMITAIEAGDLEAAASEITDSKLGREDTPNRAKQYRTRFLNG